MYDSIVFEVFNDNLSSLGNSLVINRIIFNNKTMRKGRTQIGFGFSGKRSSLQTDKPIRYEGQWQHQNSRSTFFKNMKYQLSNIKNDFEKLIRKENCLAPPHRQIFLHSSHRHSNSSLSSKLKSHSHRKEDKRSIPHKSDGKDVACVHYRNGSHQKETSGLRWTKDQWQFSGLAQTTPRAYNQSQDNIQLKKTEQQIDRESRQSLNRNERQNRRLEQAVTQLQNLVVRLQDDLQSTRNDNSQTRRQCECMRQQRETMMTERGNLLQKVEKLSHQLVRKMQIVDLQQKKIQELTKNIQEDNSQALRKAQLQIQELRSSSHQREKQIRERLQEKEKEFKDQISHRQELLREYYKERENQFFSEASERQVQLRNQFKSQEEALDKEREEKEKLERAIVQAELSFKKANTQLQLGHQRQLEEIKQQLLRQIEEKKQQKSEVSMQSIEQTELAVAQVKKQMNKQIEEVKWQCEDQVRELKKQWQAEVDALKANKQYAVIIAKQGFQEKLTTLNISHSQQIDALNAQIKLQQQEILKLKSSQIEKPTTMLGMNQQEVSGLLQERDFLVRELNGLAKHHHGLEEEWRRLGQAYDQLNQQLKRKQAYINDTQRLQADREKDQQKRIDHLNQTLTTYNEREQMFTQQVERLQQALQQTKSSNLYQNSTGTSQIEQQNFNLQEENRRLKEQIAGWKQGDPLGGGQIQLDSLIAQNQALKNQVNSLKAQLQSLKEMSRAYKAEIILWQEREKSMDESRGRTTAQWNQLTQRIVQLEKENMELQQEVDMLYLTQPDTQTATEQNGQAQLKQLQDVVQIQISQIQGLRQEFKEQGEKIVEFEEQSKMMKAALMDEKEVLTQLDQMKQRDQYLRKVVMEILIEKSQRWSQEGRDECLVTSLRQVIDQWSKKAQDS